MKPGDTIYVDSGTYNLATTLVLGAAARGISIVGYKNPAFPTRSTVISRGNPNFHTIELVNADDLTLDSLTVRGGNHQIVTFGGSDSDRVTIKNSQIISDGLPGSGGLYADSSNDFLTLQNNTFTAIGTTNSAFVYGDDWVISGNTFTGGNLQSLEVRGARGVVSNNTFAGVRRGINALPTTNVPANRLVIRDNLISGASEYGIIANANSLTTNNTVTGAVAGMAINGDAIGNLVYDNQRGIEAGSTGMTENNIIYRNGQFGLKLFGGANNRNNRIFNNDYGIITDTNFYGTASNNFIYNNRMAGVLVVDSGYSGGTPTIANNTIVQANGDGIQLVSSRTQNVLVKNNIIQVSSGFAINVDPAASRGFRSNYNVIHVLGSGKIGQWEGRTYNNPADWYYEVGLDKDSTFGDPQFVDLDGPDNVLGYSSGQGLMGSYYPTPDFTGTPVLTRLDSSLDFRVSLGAPVPGLPVDNFSIRWEGFVYIPTAGDYTFYERADDGMRLFLNGSSIPVIDQWDYANEQERTATQTLAVGWIPIRIDYRETFGGASFNFSWSGPGIARQSIPMDYLSPTALPQFGNFAVDDNAAVLGSSPAIDGGDPADPYYREPLPNGGRINAGALGGLAQAEPSRLQNLQIVSPNGLEKFEQGQTVPVSIRSNGLRTTQPVMLLNVGNGSVGSWFSANAFQTTGNLGGGPGDVLTNGTVDRSGVTDPIPAELYRTYAYSNGGAGNVLNFRLPVPDGTYSIRMHFVEAIALNVGDRRFDIRVNGTTVRANYDIMAAAGTRFKAVAETLNGLVASQGNGLSLDFVNLTTQPAYLQAIEVFTATPQGAPTPTAALDFSRDGGVTWQPIVGAQAVPLDRWGNATYNWTIPAAQTSGNNYRVRARSSASTGLIEDTSYASFIISNSGRDYYVNDNSLAGDVFTSAAGNNAASGKLPSEPMSSLSALLAAYSFEPGDVIHIDNGSYQLIKSINLNSGHSGIRIEGPTSGSAILDRNNLSYNVIDLANVDDLTLDRLTVRGGNIGIVAGAGSDSDRVTIKNSTISSSVSYAVLLDTSSDFATLDSNTMKDSANGALLSGNDLLVTGNSFTGISGSALDVRGLRTAVRDNTFTNTRIGIQASLARVALADRQVISNNVITGASEAGVYAADSTLLTQNTISGAGIGIASNGAVVNNIVFDNRRGIDVGLSASAEGNTIFHNETIGLQLFNAATNRNNRIYDNDIGILTDFSFTSSVNNNFVYNNRTAGILVAGSGYYGGVPTIANNTVIQPTVMRFSSWMVGRRTSWSKTTSCKLVWAMSSGSIAMPIEVSAATTT